MESQQKRNVPPSKLKKKAETPKATPKATATANPKPKATAAAKPAIKGSFAKTFDTSKLIPKMTKEDAAMKKLLEKKYGKIYG